MALKILYDIENNNNNIQTDHINGKYIKGSTSLVAGVIIEKKRERWRY